MKILQIFFFSFLLLALKLPIQAQENVSTTLIGRILSLEGYLMPNIKVKAISQTNIEYETRTNEDGAYSLKLPRGLYTFEVNAEQTKTNAWETVRLNNYRIVPAYDGKINLDISLSAIGDGIVCVLTVETPEMNKRKTSKRLKNKFIKRKENNKQ